MVELAMHSEFQRSLTVMDYIGLTNCERPPILSQHRASKDNQVVMVKRVKFVQVVEDGRGQMDPIIWLF